MGRNKILVTGGPVHAYLDAVKIITNRFKGGRMVALASQLQRDWDCDVTYLTSEFMGSVPEVYPGKAIYHKGFEDYMQQVLTLAPEFDAVVLGAAVANLIPAEPWKGKFPSHNYKPGDMIPINFTIAPRVINKVHEVAPKAHVFGFKLLSGVDHEELIRAAYEVQQASRATTIFANDATNLDQKYAVTKERAVHAVDANHVAEWVWTHTNDEYYRTDLTKGWDIPISYTDDLKMLINRYRLYFREVEGGYIFGTVATRLGEGFVTTARGKKELEQWSFVHRVDHKERVVYSHGHKATLNAPLLDQIFKENKRAHKIVHYHQEIPEYPTVPYAPAGTVRDTTRDVQSSFNVKGHGCYLILDENETVV